MAADHAVHRGGIALDINPLDEDARPAGYLELHIQCQFFIIADHTWLNADKAQALLGCEVFQTADGLIHQTRRIGRARTQADGILIGLDIHIGKIAGRGQFPKIEALTFDDIEGDEIGVAAARQLGHHGLHFEINKAAFAIEIGQKLLVESHTVGHEGVARHDRAEEACLGGFQHAAQAAVGIGTVADKGDPLGLDHAAFGHFKHQIHAVVGAADDLRCHGCRQTARLTVSGSDRFGILFRDRRRINAARLRGQNFQQVIIIKAVIAFDIDAVDRGVFLHDDGQRAATRYNFHGFKQARILQALQRVIHHTA